MDNIIPEFSQYCESYIADNRPVNISGRTLKHARDLTLSRPSFETAMKNKLHELLEGKPKLSISDQDEIKSIVSKMLLRWMND